MRVMFDLDGVLRNYDLAWRMKFADHFKTTIPLPSGHWSHMRDMLETQGVPKSHADDFYFNQHGYDITSQAEPFDGACEAVMGLQMMGHEIIIATDQPTLETRLGTLKWLYKYVIVPDELIFTKNKTDAIADWYIEDKQETLEKLIEYRDRSYDFEIVGIRRPWNNLDVLDGIHIVDTVSDYVKLIALDERQWIR